MKYTARNNYVANERNKTIYIADTDRDARKIAELMNLLSDDYDPPTEDEQRRNSYRKGVNLDASIYR